ncbi:Cupredoxin [Mycotypha africana]|uniref:Cupredoxin n=1 Tax=Mycotypha africana TaxID=64632 RepID=UPI002301F343|nr:Cupredoxin [Mycotypha africana]KAI8983977.1 Cupredoxin [Mycotypha africana]
MTTTDENKSTYFKESGERAGLSMERMEELARTDRFFNESNQMYHINGYVYNNHPVINLAYGSRVRWYVISFEEKEEDKHVPIDDEGDNDVHTAHWHGASLLYHGRRVDVVDLTPISFEVVDMVPDNVGQWLFHCHVAAHFDAGMSAFYQVEEVVYTGDEGWG